MGYIGAMLVIGLLFLGVFVGRWVIAASTPDERDRMGVNGISVALMALLLLFAGGITLGGAIHSVPAGHVGLVYTFGDITGQRSAGFQMTWPWQGFKSASIQGQTLCFMDETDSNKCPEGSRKISTGLDSFSIETQNVYIDAIMNIQVDPDNIQDLYRDWGDAYVTKIIPGRVDQIFKDETVKYTAVGIAPAREQIKSDVQRALRVELGAFSISVIALNIANIQFDPEFEAAILAKQNANQEALKQFELIAAKKNEAEQKKEEANGTASKLRIEAEGQAAANRSISNSLTPSLIQWQTIQQLVDNIQIMLLPSDGNSLFDVSRLLPQATQ